MTEPGANWVRKALDPFHDFQVRLDGLPDENNSKVVIQEVTKTFTIAAPAGIASNWDCHIFTLPEMTDPSCYPQVAPGSFDEPVMTLNAFNTLSIAASQPGGGSYPWGLLNFFATDPGAITAPAAGSTFGGHGEPNVISFAEYMDGQKRLIALAFEVHDTTAELYKQGNVVVYRMPQAISSWTGCSTTDTQDTPTTGLKIIMPNLKQSRVPPATQAEALLLTGSQQWEAREGVYCVCTMNVDDNCLTGYDFTGRIFTQGDLDNQANRQALITPIRANFGLGSAVLDASTAVPCRPTPFHTSGAYFAGLNVQSTLTLTVRAIFESAPTPDNPQLVVLAKPSPDLDVVALEIYKAASQQMLAGCKVADNASGDFWDTVLNVISDVAPIIGSVLPIPGGAALGSFAGQVSSTIAKKRNAKDSGRKAVAPGFSDAPGGKNAVGGAKAQQAQAEKKH